MTYPNPEQQQVLRHLHGTLLVLAPDEHLQARILEMIETLDALRASAEMAIYREVEQDEQVIDRIAAAQREELEQEIAAL